MKRTLGLLLVLTLLLAGCAAAEAPAAPAAPAAVMENPAGPAQADAESAPAPAPAPAVQPAPEPAPAAADTASGGVDALAVALKETGLTEADIRAPKVKTDTEDGVPVLEVEFYVPSQRTEYEFEIDAKTGAVREQKSEGKGLAVADDATVKPEADILALVLAKIPGAAEKDAAIYLDRDDDTLRYEGVVRYGGVEYEFEIDPWTGEFLEWESETMD